MTEKKKSSVVPQEYVDKMQEYNIDDWRKQKIADALRYQQERETGAAPPAWFGADEDFYSKKFDSYWKNCLATATDPYGEGCYESYNPSFEKNYQEKGFRLLSDEDDEQLGDIYVDYYKSLDDMEDNRPIHAITLTSYDSDGNRKFTYGSGDQNIIKKDVNYPLNKGEYKRYRFHGLPSDLAEIEAHNARVKEYNEKTAPLREKRDVALLETKPLKKSLMEEGLDKHLKMKKNYE